MSEALSNKEMKYDCYYFSISIDSSNNSTVAVDSATQTAVPGINDGITIGTANECELWCFKETDLNIYYKENNNQKQKTDTYLVFCNSCNCLFYRFSATSTVSFNNSFLLFSRRFKSSRIILQKDITIWAQQHSTRWKSVVIYTKAKTTHIFISTATQYLT